MNMNAFPIFFVQANTTPNEDCEHRYHRCLADTSSQRWSLLLQTFFLFQWYNLGLTEPLRDLEIEYFLADPFIYLRL